MTYHQTAKPPCWPFPGADSSALAGQQEVTPELSENYLAWLLELRGVTAVYFFDQQCFRPQTCLFVCFPGILKEFLLREGVIHW